MIYVKQKGDTELEREKITDWSVSSSFNDDNSEVLSISASFGKFRENKICDIEKVDEYLKTTYNMNLSDKQYFELLEVIKNSDIDEVSKYCYDMGFSLEDILIEMSLDLLIDYKKARDTVYDIFHQNIKMDAKIVDFRLQTIANQKYAILQAKLENKKYITLTKYDFDSNKVDIVSNITKEDLFDLLYCVDDITYWPDNRFSNGEKYVDVCLNSIEKLVDEYKDDLTIQQLFDDIKFKLRDDSYDPIISFNYDGCYKVPRTITNEEKVMNNEEIPIDSMLYKCTTDLTDSSFKGNPAIGREEEIKKTIVSLFNGSAILVGEAGVGKTAIAEGIAYNIQKDNVPEYLKDKKILKITSTSIVSGCTLVGELEEKMEELLKEVIARDDIILFFDEIHTAIGTGKGSKGTLDVANILKPYLDRGQIKIIGATTNEEYEEYFKNEGAFRRRLEKVEVKEPNKEYLYQIVDGSIDNIEKITNISLDNELNREVIVSELLDLTDLAHRDFKNINYNPDLVLSIIKKSFGYAAYYGHNTLKYSDIEEAVDSCDTIYPAVKERFNMHKSRMIKTDKNKQKQKTKIISFNDIKKR